MLGASFGGGGGGHNVQPSTVMVEQIDLGSVEFSDDMFVPWDFFPGGNISDLFDPANLGETVGEHGGWAFGSLDFLAGPAHARVYMYIHGGFRHIILVDCSSLAGARVLGSVCVALLGVSSFLFIHGRSKSYIRLVLLRYFPPLSDHFRRRASHHNCERLSAFLVWRQSSQLPPPFS